MDKIPMRLMRERRYGLIAVDEIVIPHPRDRNRDQFAENVRSIRDVGLQKPILVNERFRPTTGKYELVCGEGRLKAHQILQKPRIAAEIIDCDRKEAYLMTLVENIARARAKVMWFAREIKRMRDDGMDLARISLIVGRSESYVRALIALVEHGEERLIRGVEDGVFPISLALRIMESGEAKVREILIEAYDTGLVTTANLRPVRDLIEKRLKDLKRKSAASSSSDAPKDAPYTVTQLKEDIAKTVQEKESFVREANAKEGRLVTLAEGLKSLRVDKEFMDLLKAEGLEEMPKLKSLEPKSESRKEGEEARWKTEPISKA